jgi:DNA mismatch repair protein MutL
MSERRAIALLPDRVARKIAAGEVIDRPASVLRELLDNAVDAGSRQVSVSWISGGLTEIKVIDDGWGMSREDLELCVLPHATSKIRSPEDLDDLRTLGFRGEALPSIGACSRLEIISLAAGGPDAYRLSMDSGTDPVIKSTPANPGTRVIVQDLFYALPARRRFLKSPGAESRLCRSILEEKALACPGVGFSLSIDGQLKEKWPATDAEGRFRQIYQRKLEIPKMFPLQKKGEGWELWGMASIPGYVRKDRKHLQVYVNRRKINEFAFLQAISYAYSTVLPGGFFPHVCLFLEVNPSLVDFNIHPAKKEARFRNHKELHKGIVAALREQIALLDPYQDQIDPARELEFGVAQQSKQDQGVKRTPPGNDSYAHPGDFQQVIRQDRWTLPEQRNLSSPAAPQERTHHAPLTKGAHSQKQRSSYQTPATPRGLPQESPEPFQPPSPASPNHPIEEPQGLHPNPTARLRPDSREPWRFLGQIMGVFLLVEWEGKLLILDQHAAHERILFDQLKAMGTSQELLFPRLLRLEEGQAASLREEIPRWRSIGITLTESPEGIVLTHVPASCSVMEKEIADFFEDFESNQSEDLEATLFANLACKAAVKSGDFLDENSAVELIRKAFDLLTARCPHGRPLWIIMDREELYKRFGRIL